MKQITVIVNNEPGEVADITAVMAEHNINIESLTANGPANVVVLSVDKYDTALMALRDAGFQAISEDAFVIRMKDEPGALAKIAVKFKDASINIRSMRIIRRDNGFSIATIVCNKSDEAAALLKDVLVENIE